MAHKALKMKDLLKLFFHMVCLRVYAFYGFMYYSSTAVYYNDTHRVEDNMCKLCIIMSK